MTGTALEHIGPAAVACATVLSYRFLASPAVRALARWAAGEGGRAPRIWATAMLLPAAANVWWPAPDLGPLKWFLVFVVALLTWRIATTDYDLSVPVAPQRRLRALLTLLALGGCLWPWLLLPWLAVACGPLRGWQHHAMMPLRLLKAYFAWYVAVAVLPLESALSARHFTNSAVTGLLLVLGCVSLSHYLKAAWSKARLGPHWWSWAWHNRTHYLIASAYSWGWARFLPSHAAVRILRAFAPWDRALNIGAFAVELSGVLAFSNRWVLVSALLATALFNTVVALASGIVFWENVCANVGLAVVTVAVPDMRFGWATVLTALPLMLLAVADLLWQPWHLGWWDTPFTARVHWEVRTVSGRRLSLYNDFMCPYERDFGRVHGYFLTDQPILHGHLGTVFDLRLRDHLLKADGDPEAVSRLKRQEGQVFRDAEAARQHLIYLRAVFTQLNGGAPKGPVPSPVRRLKAPGGQFFYWGDLPPYQGDEPVDRISIRYEERYYRPGTGEFLVLTDQPLRSVDIPLHIEPDRSTGAENLR